MELLDLVGNLLLTLIIIGLRLVQNVQLALQRTDFLLQLLNFITGILDRRGTGRRIWFRRIDKRIQLRLFLGNQPLLLGDLQLQLGLRRFQIRRFLLQLGNFLLIGRIAGFLPGLFLLGLGQLILQSATLLRRSLASA